jgi:hypothetical protein
MTRVIWIRLDDEARRALSHPKGVGHEQGGRRLVDATRLGKRVAHLTTEERWAVDEAFLTVFGLR